MEHEAPAQVPAALDRLTRARAPVDADSNSPAAAQPSSFGAGGHGTWRGFRSAVYPSTRLGPGSVGIQLIQLGDTRFIRPGKHFMGKLTISTGPWLQ